MAEPIIHHRTPQFSQVLTETGGMLRELYQTEQPVLMISGSGTAGMEAVVANLIAPNDKALIVRAGKFGERWSELVTAYGGISINIDVPWGEAVDPKIVSQKLAETSDIVAVFVQASETSTATEHPIEELAKIIHQQHNQVLLCVDGITGVGCFPLQMDEWGIDALVCGSQKALQLPPGLATISLSERAWQRAESHQKTSTYYLDLCKEKKAQVEQRTTAWTAPVSLINGLHEVLTNVLNTGLDNIFEHHQRLAKATQSGLQAIGLKLYSQAPSRSVTAAWVPDGVDGGALVKYLRDTVGVTIAGGQAKLKGKIIRIGHLGYVDTFDIIAGLTAIELGLDRLGHPVHFGRGPAAAMDILKEGYAKG
ncbi:serine-pyruvate aminotransferase-like [Ylistrum balloti]|uniref:serine-pyruvate aminotransferase-like n=1 Tax=Ylistrum balloti TaxID=509963 RepID=UPI002905B2BC|nr:serine-pyruvate aminotransferase-like [Ylistrum balloti]